MSSPVRLADRRAPPLRRRFVCCAAGTLLACAGLPGPAPALQRPPDAGALRRALEFAEGAAEGRSGETLHVFFDALCPACMLLYRRTRGAVRAGRLRLQWIPVSLLGPASLMSAAQLLAARDRARALARMFEHPDASPARSRRALAMVPAVLGNGALLRWLAGPRAATPCVLTEVPGQGWMLRIGVGP
jgi:hypothetical protein